ncbi:hypothetical protein Vretifemale_12365 [Volvox reticuliferus]|uniref:Guanylate cyclase domain-containing protein n=1 Tax=Volvox reticuliferus TaxID=1737510 RepID=A0A8J4FPG5_9CHLO|nr:hypothetical protein Vretifemale_12365 [Volvox reticuliferus]
MASPRIDLVGRVVVISHLLTTLPNSVRMTGLRAALFVSAATSPRGGHFTTHAPQAGDTVNTASRMESTGSPGCIHVSQSTYELLRDEAWVPTGGIEVKGKGLMQTYLWQGSLELAPGVHPDLPEALEAAVAAAAPGLRSMTIGKTPSHTVQKIAQVSSSVAQLQDLLMGSVAGRTAVTGVSAGTGNCVVPAVSGLTTSGISDQGLALAIAEGLLQRVTAGLGGASTCSDHQTVSCVGHGAIDPADADVADCNSRHHVR